MKKGLYQKSNLDKIRKHFQDTGGSDTRWFNIRAPERGQEAKAIIRVLPPWGKSAEGFFYYTVAQHFGFSIGGRNRAISCPESVNRGKCPVCKFISRLKSSGEADHDKLQQRLRGNRRYFVNVIDREEPDVIRIFGTNKKCIEAILDASDDPDVGDITDPKTGRDLIIVRRGSGLRTRYSYRVRTNSSLISFKPKELYQLDKEVDEWMDYNTMTGILRDNFGEELKEVGLKFKPSKLKRVKKGKKVEDEEEDTYDEEDIEESLFDEDEEEE